MNILEILTTSPNALTFPDRWSHPLPFEIVSLSLKLFLPVKFQRSSLKTTVKNLGDSDACADDEPQTHRAIRSFWNFTQQ